MFLKLSIILIWSCLLVQGKMDCKSDGYFPNSDCTGFYQCVFTGTASAQQYYTACPSGLLFDAASILCNWASQVKCNSNNQVTTATRKTTTATTKKGDVTTSPKTTTATTKKGDTTTSSSSGNLITQEEFKNALTSNGYPAPSPAQYQNLVSQAGPKGGITSKQQLAMFLSEIMWESDGLRATREYYCYPTLNAGCNYNNGGGVPGQNYYGRGYIQLTWNYNYKDASSSLYGSDILLKNPDMVATDDKVAWATAFWFWKDRVVGSKFGSQVLNGQFGAATNAINGGLECTGAHADKARKRFEIYKKVLTVFNVSAVPNETGCYN